MALASLTVDLTLKLASFENDSGKAAQIITRDTEKMSRAAKLFENSLQKQAEQAGRTQAEYLALKAAEAGLGENAQRFIDIIARAEKAAADATGATRSLYQASSSASLVAEQNAAKQVALNNQLLVGLQRINAEYQRQKEIQIGREAAGTINPTQLKDNLKNLAGQRQDSLDQLKAEYAKDRAAIDAANADAETQAKRAAGLQKLLDTANRLRQEDVAAEKAAADKKAADDAAVLAKRQNLYQTFRDNVARMAYQSAEAEKAAGQAAADAEAARLAKLQSSFEQLRASNAKRNYREDIEAQEAVAAEAKKVADERQAQFERDAAAAQKLIDKQNGLTGTFREQYAELQRLLSVKAISPEQFDTERQRLFSQQPSVVAAQKAAQEQIKAAEAVAAENEKRLASSRALLDVENGLTSTYRAQIKALVALREAGPEKGGITDAEFTKLKAALVESQPIIKARNAEREAIEQEERAVISLIERLKGLGPAFAKQAEDLKAAQAAAAAKLVPEKATGATSTPHTQAYLEELFAARKTAEGVVTSEERKQAAQAETLRQFEEGIKRKSQLLSFDPKDRNVENLKAQYVALGGAVKDLEPHFARIREADHNMGVLGKTTGLTTNQFLQLKYTISDVIASAASGISPMTILLQQGTQLGQVEGIFKGIRESITPLRLAIGGAAAAAGVLAFAFYEGQKQSREYKDAITLTGNGAGITAGHFNELARSIAASTTATVGNAREFAQALISTGQVGPQVFDQAAKAAVRFGAATGQNAKQVAQDFASMSDSVTKWVTEHNKSLNLFSAAEILHIRELEAAGKEIEAQALVYEKLNKRLDDLRPNLGLLDKALASVKKGWSSFWDAAFDVGRDETIEDKLARTRKALFSSGIVGQGNFIAPSSVNIETRVPNTQVAAQVAADQAQRRESDLENYRFENKQAQVEAVNAFLTGQRAQETKKAAEEVDKLGTQYGKSAHLVAFMNEKLAENEARFKRIREEAAKSPDFAKSPLVQSLLKPGVKEQVDKEIRESYSDKKGISDADQLRKAALAHRLADIEAAFQKEKATLDFHLRELDARYRAGEVSFEQYYEDKRATIAAGTAAELSELGLKVQEFDKELARNQFKDPHEREDTLKQRAEVLGRAAALAIQAGRDVVLSNEEQDRSYIALIRQIDNYQAELASLSGDELKAARIRNEIAAVQERIFQRQAGNAPNAPTDAELERRAKLRDIIVQTTELQRKNQFLAADASRAEELFTLRAQQDGLSLKDTEAGIYQIRAAALVQLGQQVEEARRLALEAEAAGADNRELARTAADLALQYARAADQVSPFYNRLRQETKALADTMASTIGNVFSNWSSIYRQHAAQDRQNVDQQKQAYDKQIADLNDYLRQTSDAKDAAFLKERIKDVQRQRDSVKASGGEFLKTVQDVVLRPLAHQIFDTLTKVTITQPISAAFEGYFNDILKKVLPSGSLVGEGALKAAQSTLVASTDQLSVKQFELMTSTYQLTYAVRSATDALATISGSAFSSSFGFKFSNFTGYGTPGGGGVGYYDPEALAQILGAAKGRTFERGSVTAFGSGGMFPDPMMTDEDQWKWGMGYARGGQFTNTVVTEPTRFRYGASGSQYGLMGEAGPEAIMPLKRAKDGSLGVRVYDDEMWGAIIPLKRGPDGSLGISGWGDKTYGARPKSQVATLDIGTNYVPYDNMPALLHKGEAVVPAKFNPAAGGNAPGSGLVVNVHPAQNTEVQSIEKSNDGKELNIVMRQTEKFIAGRAARGMSPLNSGLKARGIDQSRGLSKRG